MTVTIDRQTCSFDTPNGSKDCSASELTIITDADKAMSAVEVDGKRIYITEAEADALTVAGAADERKHLKASESGSAI
ncbi:DUF3203 family protein [Pseudomonas sp. B21-056]|jgi:hypothetical protein|uniref:DUF3203 family protein n=1 Tax=Pseudomonas sp. B21-056 TaxID=2895495 RepID=UPI0022322D57|nr:DUF3203 family protein [Pseudomonas sp. B21-056]UZE25803.1 DUF3203 family protein [Pseudomonas sp. B21-056]